MIQFILNNQVIKTSENSGGTLLDFIRESEQLKGTKTGCREGDCGACTVLVGTLNNEDLSYQSITSCLSPLGNAHGKHIVTVEGINLPNELNQVQKAMTDNYATQCGFCTPGFVVSMTGFALKGSRLDSDELQTCNDAISGNICRCTGYKSIEKAGRSIEKQLQERDNNHKIDWLIKEGFIPDYFQTIPNKLGALLEEIERSTPTSKEPFVAPKNGEKLVANGTDLYVQQADKLVDENICLLANEPELKGIEFTEGVCTMGISSTATEMAESKELQTLFPKLRHFMKLVSSEQIRNMGTLGGNFVNASPIGDMSIFFLALNSTLRILKADGTERNIPFQLFHQNYKVIDLQEGEVLKSISFDVPKPTDHFNFEKVSKRTHLDITSVNSAARLSVEQGIITAAHVSIGGVSAIPKYLDKTNAFLIGKPMDEATIREAAEVVQTEISPLSDVRGTAEYKRLLARQLFYAHFIELFPGQVELAKLTAS